MCTTSSINAIIHYGFKALKNGNALSPTAFRRWKVQTLLALPDYSFKNCKRIKATLHFKALSGTGTLPQVIQSQLSTPTPSCSVVGRMCRKNLDSRHSTPTLHVIRPHDT